MAEGARTLRLVMVVKVEFHSNFPYREREGKPSRFLDQQHLIFYKGIHRPFPGTLPSTPKKIYHS